LRDNYITDHIYSKRSATLKRHINLWYKDKWRIKQITLVNIHWANIKSKSCKPTC